jgi:clostripain
VDPAGLTAAEFGRLVTDQGYQGRQAAVKSGQKMTREAAGCYDLRKAGAVKKAVDVLSQKLAQANDAQGIVLDVRGTARDGVFKYSDDGSNVDLYDLCRRLAVCDRLPPDVQEAAKGVMDAVERFMIASFGMSAYKGFEPGKNGVYIVLPSGAPGCWKQFAWYTPLAGKGKVGRWSFLADGATPGNGVVENWFELLVKWFDEPDEKGGSKGYRP